MSARTKTLTNALAPLKQRPKWKLKKVDGFKIRMRYPDWDVVETALSTKNCPLVPSVPQNEAHIDQRFWQERKFLLNVHWHERALKNLGWSRRKIRKYIKRHLTKPGAKPERAKYLVPTTKAKGLTICYVRGDMVRAHFDPQFVFGGHDLVYRDYISKNEVWIDAMQDNREIKYTLFHELFERRLMARGMRYNPAHALATKAEKKLRAKDMRRPR